MGKPKTAPGAVRTVALVGHRSSGKTTLAEALLHRAGVVRSQGQVESGNTLLDRLPEERRRRMSLETGFAWMEVGRHRLYLLDVPGSAAAAPERQIAGEAADTQVLVVSSAEGIQQGDRRALSRVGRGPMLVVMNKLDRAPAEVLPVWLETMQALVGDRRLVPVQLPIYEGATLVGLIDLLRLRFTALDRPGDVQEIPGAYRAAARRAREQLVEAVALADDHLLEMYLDLFDLDDALVEQGLARAVSEGKLTPVCYAAGINALGASNLLDVLCSVCPSPVARTSPMVDSDGAAVVAALEAPFAAQLVSTQRDQDGTPYHVLRVWSGVAPVSGSWQWEGGGRAIRKVYAMRGPRRKVADYVGPGAIIATWESLDIRPGEVVYQGRIVRPRRRDMPRPVVERCIRPMRHRDMERLAVEVKRLAASDAGCTVRMDAEGRLVLGGVNSSHLERLMSRVSESIRIESSLPRVPFRETPRRPGAGEYEHVKTVSGEPVQYARVALRVSAMPSTGLAIEFSADPEELPMKWHAAIEDGLREAVREGPCGFPLDGLRVDVVDGAYDLFASDEGCFVLAATEAFRRALREGGTEVLEPMLEVEIDTPSARVGELLTEIAQREGRVIGLEAFAERTRVAAEMPYREVRILGARLEALTSGEASFEASPGRYAPVREGVWRAAMTRGRPATPAPQQGQHWAVAPVPG